MYHLDTKYIIAKKLKEQNRKKKLIQKIPRPIRPPHIKPHLLIPPLNLHPIHKDTINRSIPRKRTKFQKLHRKLHQPQPNALAPEFLIHTHTTDKTRVLGPRAGEERGEGPVLGQDGVGGREGDQPGYLLGGTFGRRGVDCGENGVGVGFWGEGFVDVYPVLFLYR